ncbi:MAG: WG repeat-containing protein [Saprospiraceae bacterium]|nr:WG repeat-containing protein [Saprospiraceae bacterium]
MQLNKQILLTIVLLPFLTLSAFAQINSSPAVVNSKGVKTSDAEYITSGDQARKQIMSLYNLFRDYSVTVDVSNTDKTSDTEPSYVAKETSPTYFKIFLSKLDAALRRRVEALAAASDNVAEKEKMNKAILLLKNSECFAEKEKGVFMVTKDQEGNEIIAFPLDSLRKKSRYGIVDNYTEGYARIQKDQVFGFLNLCGEEAITCQYEKAEPFNHGMALVRRIDWFFVDTKGNESAALDNVIDARSLGNGVSLLKFNNNALAIVNNDYATNKAPLSSFYESIEPFFKRNDVLKVRNGKKYGVIGLNGKIKIDPNYDDIAQTNAAGIYRINLGGRIGLVDSNWKIQYPPSFTSISDFNEFGIAEAKNENGTVLIQKNGLTKSKTYDNIGAFSDFGVAVIRDLNKNYGLIDTTFKVIVEPKYFSIGSFNEMGLASACLQANKCGFIRYDGSEQIKANYESVGNFNSFGLAIAKVNVTDYKGKKNEKLTAQIVIDAQGNTIIPVTDEAIEKKFNYELSDTVHSNDYLIVYAFAENSRNDPRFHLIKKVNNQLVTSTPYQTISAIDNVGNMRVKKDNLWGVIDSTGKILSKCQFNQIQRVSENYYAVENATNKWGFINQKGKQQIPFEYDEVRTFRNGYVVVSKGKGKWGLINRFNAKVIPCLFKSITDKGTKYEVTDNDGLIYIVNEEGDCETNCPKFEQIRRDANKAATAPPPAPVKKQ